MPAINWSSPVNWDDAINRGLLAWWLVVPHWKGGSVLRDLTRLNDSVLKNLEPADWTSGGDRPGNIGGALDFDGTDEYTEAPGGGPNLESLTSQLTIAMWCNITSLAAQGYMLSKGLGAAGNWTAYRLRMETDGDAAFSIQHNTLNEFPHWRNQTAISVGDWHHYIFVLHGMTASESDVSSFLDGKPESTDYLAGNYSASFTTLVMNSGSVTGSTRIGSGFGSAPEDFFNTVVGALDDVQIWGRPLNDAECVQVYQDSLARHPRMLRRLKRRAVAEQVAEDLSHVAALADSFDNVVQRRPTKITSF